VIRTYWEQKQSCKAAITQVWNALPSPASVCDVVLCLLCLMLFCWNIYVYKCTCLCNLGIIRGSSFKRASYETSLTVWSGTQKKNTDQNHQPPIRYKLKKVVMRSNKELTIPNLGLLLGIPLCGMIYRLMVLYIQYIYIYMHRLQTNGFPLCLATHVYTRRLYELISEANGQMV